MLFLFALVARPSPCSPAVACPLTSRGEAVRRLGRLKGAVPILLAAFALVGDVEEAPAIYNIVFVVVALSVLVQGSTILGSRTASGSDARRRAGAVGRLDPLARARADPAVHRRAAFARARQRDPDRLGERAWVSFVVQDGTTGARPARVPRGRRVHVLGDPDDERVLQRRVRRARRQRPTSGR